MRSFITLKEEIMNEKNDSIHGTTILAVRRGGNVALAGDGQVTLSNTILKHKAKKIRRLYHDKIIAGFSGATADAFTLFEKFEKKLNQFNGNITRAAVELAKDWRTDKYLRRLEALLLIADQNHCFIISGNGDVIEPDDMVTAVGSGGPFAQAAAKALLDHTNLSASEIVREAMKIAAGICIYTNDQIIIEEL